MSALDIIILGIVEGLTEFLPISSTAHLIIASKILGLNETSFLQTFQIAIQLGAIMAVVWVYRKTLIYRPIIWKKITYAFIPTAILGFVLYKAIKNYLLTNNWLIASTLIVGGIILILFELRKETNNDASINPTLNNENIDSELERLPDKKAFIIGLAQSIAIIPGVSRSAATIVSGRLLGLSRLAVVEFSFLLAIPTIFAATGYDLLKNYQTFTNGNWIELILGFIFSFVAALFAVKFFIDYLQKHNFLIFGVYRIIIGVIFAIYLLSI